VVQVYYHKICTSQLWYVYGSLKATDVIYVSHQWLLQTLVYMISCISNMRKTMRTDTLNRGMFFLPVLSHSPPPSLPLSLCCWSMNGLKLWSNNPPIYLKMILWFRDQSSTKINWCKSSSEMAWYRVVLIRSKEEQDNEGTNTQKDEVNCILILQI